MKMSIYKIRGKLSRVVGFFLLAMILMFSSYWKDGVIGESLFMLGIILVSIATIGRIWCMFYIAGHKTQQLVIQGPYSMCRNPLYFCSFVGAVGVGFLTETFTMPLVIAAFFAVYYPGIIKMEQRRLLKVHGKALEDYMRSVPAFWPSLLRFSEPEVYQASPIIFRKHLPDAVAFIMMIAVAEFIELLHDSGVIHTLGSLY